MRTVLIVDDEERFRNKFKKMLVKAGFDVIEASSALEVAEALMRDRSKIDLVLLDINLPEVDGRGIFEIVDEYAPNLDMIVTSVLPLTDQKLRIPRAIDYFQKSKDSNILLNKVRNALGIQV